MDIYVIGAGGHGEVVLDNVRAGGVHRVVGFLDSNEALRGTVLDGVPVLGLPAAVDGPFVVAIGDNAARKSFVETFTARGLEAVTITHPTAYIASSARIGSGTVICTGAVVCSHARIGRGAIINTGAVVEHHNRIGDFAHVAPGVVLAGRTTVEEGALIGAGATVIPFMTVGSWSTVGAGSVIIEDVPSGATVVGSPARAVHPGAAGGQLAAPEDES